MAAELLIVLLLTVLNGVFSASEIAILSVRKTRLAEAADAGSQGARAARWLRAQPERFLATVQIGITVVGTTAAAFGGDSLAEHLAGWLGARVPWLGAYAHRAAFVLVIALISFLGIVVGELVPKSLALRNAERLSIALAPMLRTLSSVVKPLVWLFTASSNVILRLFGDRTSFSEARLSPEELQELVEEAGRTGAIDPGTSEIASRAIDFRELTAADVMVPREHVVALAKDAPAAGLAERLQGVRYARLPVYEGEAENVVGYVSLRELLVPSLRGAPSLAEHVRPIQFVPLSTPAAKLLRRMQRERLPMVMVIDEGGGLRGLVTVEDLVEELVGDIVSERDPAPPALAREADGSAIVPGETAIRDVNRALDLSLPEPDAVTTLAGLCIVHAGHLPRAGERFTLPEGYVLEVLDATPRKVRSVRVLVVQAPAAAEEDRDGSVRGERGASGDDA